jgi:signal transduction histidine kinase
MTNAKIMIVEDESITAMELEGRLEYWGYTVLPISSSGKKAIEIATTMAPDLILMDINLKGKMDGVETMEHIKEHLDVPVIYLTAYSDEATLQRAKITEPYGYILKPFEERELYILIEVALYKNQMEQKLKKANIELQTRNSELKAFAHTVAHDLKTPLNIITGFAEVLTDSFTEMSKEELKEHLQSIVRNGHKMVDIIDALLLLASVRDVKVEMKPLQMTDIIAEVHGRLTKIIEEAQAEIILPDTWPVAMGHPTWVEEVWANYLSNAIKYGGQPPRIELGAIAENGMIRYWIQDNGAGLTPEEQARLFTPFTRLNQADDIQGHGLGLSIVQRIVEKLGGKIGIESAPGQGSIFSFTLPEANQRLTS